jgi:hypothetical protein
MMFLVRNVFRAEESWQQQLGEDAPDMDMVEAILNESGKLAAEQLHPANALGDKQGCTLTDEGVSVPTSFQQPWRALVEGGWPSLAASPDFGGQGMPKMLASLVEEMQWSANPAFRLYAAATAGVALLLEDQASDALKQAYLPQLVAGEWAGTMALTEPHCGTDLGLLRTKATPNEDGAFALSGTKIFITGGDNDLTENIVHLVLARLPGAPSGTAGISLFLVPKFLVNQDGSLGARNGVYCDALEEKMGIKGSATCVLRFEDASAWMVGAPHRGLKAMFTMMDYERVNIGLQGLGSSELAYQVAAAYAKERRQGRSLTGPLDPAEPADTLLAHADVRRSLLTLRAYNEAGRAFAMYLGEQLDKVHYEQNAAARHRAQNLVDLMTPVVKAFATDKGFEGCVTAQQLFGGHGYIRETGVEQLVRDARIGQIYEGANGVIALSLIGRQVVSNGGVRVQVFLQDVDACIATLSESGSDPWLLEAQTALQQARDTLANTTEWLVQQPNLAFNNEDEIGAASVDYLNLFGHVAYAFMWARMVHTVQVDQALSASDFGEAKRQLGRFYFRRLLPVTQALASAIRSGAQPLSGLRADLF